MRVLVTGGAGFIGSHLVDRLLAEGHEVRVLDSLDPQVHEGVPAHLSRDAEFVHGDIREAAIVQRCLDSVDRLVHLAAAVGVGQSMYEIERYTSVNTVGTAVVLEQAIAARDRLQKMLVASSMSIYGEGLYHCPREERDIAPPPRTAAQLAARRWEPVCPHCAAALQPLPTPETKPLAPASIYAIGKRDHEEMFLACGRAYGIPTSALRFFNVFGPRQALSNPYTGVAAIFASRLLNGRSPVVFEDGLQTRDFVHVGDVTAAICAALDRGAADGEALNVGSGRPTTILEVAAVLSRVLAAEIEPTVQNVFRAGDIRHCFGDISRAHALLGWSPRLSFDDGMSELADWLAGQPAIDRFEEATEALVERGLTV